MSTASLHRSVHNVGAVMHKLRIVKLARLTLDLKLDSIRRVSLMMCSRFSVVVIVASLVTGAYANEIEEREDESSYEHVEELIVTGSYLKSSTSHSHSPLTILDKDTMDAVGATDAQEFIAQMTANTASLGNSASNWVGGDNSEGQASVNLRNLGSGATLILLNGRRLLRDNFDATGSSYVNIRSLLPNNVLDRVEVLRDGSSALYGSDAVAGVVNFLTSSGFHGWETELEFSSDHETGTQRDTLLSTKYGRSLDSGEFLVAASYLDREGLRIADRFERYGRSGLSSFGQPGRYVPLHQGGSGTPVNSNYWHPEGGPDTSSFSGSLPDLECEKVAAADGGMGTLGIHPRFSNICVYDYSSFFHIIRPTQNYKLHVEGSYNPSPTTTLSASWSIADHESYRGNSLYPDVTYRIIQRDHFGLQLDAARRGYEPVEYQALQRLLGGTASSTTRARPVDTDSVTTSYRSRFEFGATSEILIKAREWFLTTNLSRSRFEGTQVLPTDVRSDRMDLAFRGLGGPNCNPILDTAGSGNLGFGGCYYYNSFQTSVYDPVTGEAWDTNDANPWAANPELSVIEAARKYQNPASLLTWLHGTRTRDAELEQTVMDLMLTGEGVDLGHGALGIAIGVQYRKEIADFDFDRNSNRFNLSFLTGNSDWTSSVSSWALFAETSAAVHERIELRVAGRYEKFSVGGSDTFDPKVSALITATPSILIRSSWGTSYKIASLLQSGGSLTLFENTRDPFSNAPSLAYRSSLGDGNPELEPEVADAFNIGVSWESETISGLQVSLDHYRYEYENLITRERHQSLVDLDNSLRCPSGINHDINAPPLCGVYDHDGDGVPSVFSIGEGIPDKVIRREDGYLVHTIASYFNAPSLTVTGFDASIRYAWDSGDLGRFEIASEVNYATDYTITLADGTVTNGLGKRNITNSIGRSMPEYRIRNSLNWTRNRHAMNISSFSVSDYQDEGPQSDFLASYIGYWETIDGMTTVDAQYSVDLPEFLGSELALGIKNLLNKDPPWVNVDGAYDYYTHDPTGRVYYARFRISLQ
ncbi:MAG: TonB-dependent receptor [Gammaproteobacteria bacterium]|nr:TonB-dependent receptor [Gammaproteobacteria bacterium]